MYLSISPYVTLSKLFYIVRLYLLENKTYLYYTSFVTVVLFQTVFQTILFSPEAVMLSHARKEVDCALLRLFEENLY